MHDTRRGPRSHFDLRWCDVHGEVEEFDQRYGWIALSPDSHVAGRVLRRSWIIRQEVAALRARLGGEG